MKAEEKPVFVVGGLNMDIIGAPASGELQLYESNPGKVTLRPGGVGRNMAAALAALGVPVELVTPLGNDEIAPVLERACEGANIGLRHAPRLPVPSGAYLCLHGGDGDMLSAINQMDAMEAFTPAVLAPILPALADASMILADANLPAETLRALAEGTSAPMALDPVSRAKAGRAKGILPRLLFLKPNRFEAEELTGIPCDSLANTAKAADMLLKMGIRRAYISLGADGLYYADGTVSGHIEAPGGKEDYTGAGDRLTARLTYAALRGMDTEDAARWAMRE